MSFTISSIFFLIEIIRDLDENSRTMEPSNIREWSAMYLQCSRNGDGPVNYKLLNLVVLGRYENTSNSDSDSLVG